MDMVIGRSARYASLILRNTSNLVPKISSGTGRCVCYWDSRRQNIKVYDTNLRWTLGIGSDLLRPNFITSRIILHDYFPRNGTIAYSTDTSQQPNKDSQELPPAEKQTPFQRMKQMAKDYWYILIPVHIVTSMGWATIFYIAAKNGVDVVRILESFNLSERYLDILRGSNAGHLAVAYALYKLCTPIRYTVTVGGTTMTIRYLNRWGYLKFKPRSAIKETQSKGSATESREKYAKTEFKDQQTEPPKT